MRTLVCGGRNFSDKQFLWSFLDDQKITHLICGAQRTYRPQAPFGFIGADWLAIEWAMNRIIPFTGVPADWHKFGFAAGPIRNAIMADEYAPEKCIAFPGGNGTMNMIRVAKAAGIPVINARP